MYPDRTPPRSSVTRPLSPSLPTRACPNRPSGTRISYFYVLGSELPSLTVTFALSALKRIMLWPYGPTP